MPPIYQGRPAIRHPALRLEAPALGLVYAPAPTPTPTPNIDLFQEFMRTYIEKVRAQAPMVPAAPAPDVKARDDTDRPLKSWNSNLYYGNLRMECYYFCQQCKDYFEVAGSLGHKHVPFPVRFLQDRILYRWQQHKTRMQCNRLTL